MAQVGIYPRVVPGVHSHQNVNQGGQIDHGLANLGLADDDHSHYFNVDGTNKLIGILGYGRENISILAGTLTITRSFVKVDTEGGAATDDLVTIAGGVDGDFLFLTPLYDDHTIIIRGTGNIETGVSGELILDTINSYVLLLLENVTWRFIAYSHNLTKARIDALNINADQVDGEEAAAIVTDARVKAHFPDTIANILSNHSKAVHDALAILHSSTGGRTVNDHHAQLHEAEHEVGGSDLLSFTDISGFGTWLDQEVKQASSPTFAGLLVNGKLLLTAPSELTINAGVITVTKGYHRIDGEGDAADDLVTINGGVDGMILVLQCENVGRVITLTEMGNIRVTGIECVLSLTYHKIMLFYDGASSLWVEIGRCTG